MRTICEPKNMSSAKIVFKEKKIYKDGTSPILIKITHAGKRYYKKIASVPASLWSKDKNKVLAGYDNHLKLNAFITKKIRAAEDYILNCELNGSPIEPNNFFNNDVNYIHEILESQAKEFEAKKSYSSAGMKRALSENVKEFDSLADPDKINLSWVQSFNAFLANVKNNKSTTRHRKLKHIRSINKNAFVGFKMPSSKAVKEKLTLDEIRILEQTEFNGKGVQLAVDMFLFSYYNRGIRATNLLTLHPGQLLNGRLQYFTQKKPPKFHDIELNEKSKAIIDKYKGQSHLYLFPLFKMKLSDSETFFKHRKARTSFLNQKLKKAAKQANINKNISIHTARHSFTNVLYTQNVPLRVLKEMLGHEDEKTTEQYAKSIVQSKELDDAVKGKL